MVNTRQKRSSAISGTVPSSTVLNIKLVFLQFSSGVSNALDSKAPKGRAFRLHTHLDSKSYGCCYDG